MFKCQQALYLAENFIFSCATYFLSISRLRSLYNGVWLSQCNYKKTTNNQIIQDVYFLCVDCQNSLSNCQKHATFIYTLNVLSPLSPFIITFCFTLLFTFLPCPLLLSLTFYWQSQRQWQFKQHLQELLTVSVICQTPHWLESRKQQWKRYLAFSWCSYQNTPGNDSMCLHHMAVQHTRKPVGCRQWFVMSCSKSPVAVMTLWVLLYLHHHWL